MAIITRLKCSSTAKRKREDPSSTPAVTAAADLHLVSLNYIRQGLKMSKDEIAKQRSMELYNLLGKKKLFLILDLDHTLLHTVSKKRLTPTEQFAFMNTKEDYANGVLFRSEKRITKLRPFVRTFLEEASKLFQLCVYTMGDPSYAQKMVSFLDPENKYFGARVISCNDNTRKDKKGLDVVLAPESAVLIVDDTESVWDKHAANLILIEKYNYFAAASSKGSASRTNAPSYSESFQDESETDGELALILSILTRAHQMFFDDHTMGRDVRNVLKSIWEHVDDPMDCN
ncbi:protein-serine/threonine phosphatase [Ranunculus cassubicifolius]